MNQYISNSLVKVFEPAIGQRVNYTANTGIALISTANTNLNGTGTIVTVITGNASGTHVRSVTIKALGTTTRGMVRLFITDVEFLSSHLIAEIDIPERTVSSAGIDKAFYVTLQTDIMISSLYQLRASTEKAESFCVIAEGVNTSFP